MNEKKYKVIVYSDKNGNSEFGDYFTLLVEKANNGNKDAFINASKIKAYIDLLETWGTRIGEPVIKHLEGDIWELRPLKNRVLLAYFKDNTFILLHYFVKKTRKTPRREIEKAKREFADYIEREGS